MATMDLHAACKQGDLETIKLAIIANPSQLNEKDFKVTLT